MLGLILGAIGAARGIIGAAQAKHNSNVRKNLIGEAYRNASEQLGVRQRSVREGNEEGLVARGMTGGGDATNTVAGQNRVDIEKQFGFEQRDLDFQRKEQLAQNKADLTNSYIGAVAGGVSTAANVAGAFGLHPLTAAPQSVPTTAQVPIPATPSVSGAMTGAPGTANWDFHVGGG